MPGLEQAGSAFGACVVSEATTGGGVARREAFSRGDLSPEEDNRVLRAYWKRTVRFTLSLLVAWFVVGYVVPIFLGPALNEIDFLGGPLGFWFAQNGGIYLFWLLILVYALGMNRIDREFDVHDLKG